MIVYIISYFEENQERKTRVNQVLNQYSKLFDNVVVLWMNKVIPPYYPNITYIISKRLSAPDARNTLLSLFYNSSFNCCLLADDDTLVLDLDILDVPNDVVSYVNDKYSHNVESYFISSALLKLTNLKKKYNKEIYFDPNLKVAQDLEFGVQLVNAGLSPLRYITSSVEIYKGVSILYPSIVARLNFYQEAIKYIQNKHNLILYKHGRV